MLASMETPLGLTIISPEGKALRLQANSPVFKVGKQMLNEDMPAEQAWLKINELVKNPLQVLIAWCAKFGVRLVDGEETLQVQDLSLKKAMWLPLLQRAHVAGASPVPVLRFAEALGEKAGNAQVADACLQWTAMGAKSEKGLVGVVRSCAIPAAARVGDKVTGTVAGPTAGLVSFTDFELAEDGTLQFNGGKVIAQFGTDSKTPLEIATEPVILGFNRTYRCEEGTADGWLEDLSFDSLKAARHNANEIRKSGSDVRIINRISGEAVSLT